MDIPSESVKVVVRSRPLSVKEVADNRREVVVVNPSRSSVSLCDELDEEREFTFDSVLGFDVSQESVFESTAAPIVDSVLQGYNGTIFCYGQTGSGKTYTMVGGDAEKKGLIRRVFAKIFSQFDQASAETQFLISVSYLELYNEELRDLLRVDSVKLEIGLGDKIYVKNLTKRTVKSVDEIESVLAEGQKLKMMGSTLMNAESSRSHTVFTITVESASSCDEGKTAVKVGKLNLVDLAGSERQSKTGSTGTTFKEAVKINLSLSALGNVISALIEGRYVPYRDSKLTRLLQDSLGGNTRTVMIANVGPADYNYEETLSTLRYASRAKNIKNKPRINEDPKDAVIRQYQLEIKQLKEQILENKFTLGTPLGIDGEESSSSMTVRLHELEDQLIQGKEYIEKAKLQETELILTKQKLEATVSAHEKIQQEFQDHLDEKEFLEQQCHDREGEVAYMRAELHATLGKCNQLVTALESMRKLNALQETMLELFVSAENRLKLEQIGRFNEKTQKWTFPDSADPFILSLTQPKSPPTTTPRSNIFEILENSTPAVRHSRPASPAARSHTSSVDDVRPSSSISCKPPSEDHVRTALYAFKPQVRPLTPSGSQAGDGSLADARAQRTATPILPALLMRHKSVDSTKRLTPSFTQSSRPTSAKLFRTDNVPSYISQQRPVSSHSNFPRTLPRPLIL